MSHYGSRIREIFEILVSIDFTRFAFGNQGYFSREKGAAREVGSTIELYCREIQNIINNHTNLRVSSFGYTNNFSEELQPIWNQYQPRMNAIRRTIQYNNYVEYLDDRYWPEYDYRTFLFIENIYYLINLFLIV